MKTASLLSEEQPGQEGSGDATHTGQEATAGTRSAGRCQLDNPILGMGELLQTAQPRNISVPGKWEQEGGEAQPDCKELWKGEDRERGQKTQVKHTGGLQA